MLMQNELTAGTARSAPRFGADRRGATHARPPRQMAVRSAVPTPRAAQRDSGDLKHAATWSVRVLVYGIAALIAGLWLKDGGVTGVHDAATLLISAGRLTGLFGAYTLLLQVLLMARLPFLQWAVGFDT